MANLLSNAECGPSNALGTFSKHSQQDRTLQKDRWVPGSSLPQVISFGIVHVAEVSGILSGAGTRPHARTSCLSTRCTKLLRAEPISIPASSPRAVSEDIGWSSSTRSGGLECPIPADQSLNPSTSASSVVKLGRKATRSECFARMAG